MLVCTLQVHPHTYPSPTLSAHKEPISQGHCLKWCQKLKVSRANMCLYSNLRVSTPTCHFPRTKSLYAHLNSIYAMTTMFHDVDLDPSLSSSSSNTFMSYRWPLGWLVRLQDHSTRTYFCLAATELCALKKHLVTWFLWRQWICSIISDAIIWDIIWERLMSRSVHVQPLPH